MDIAETTNTGVADVGAPETDTREAAIAAVRDVVAKSETSEEVAPSAEQTALDAGLNGAKEKIAADEPATPADDGPDLGEIAKRLKRREKDHAERAETKRQQEEIRAMMADLKRQKEELSKREEWFDQLKKDPATAFREAGWDPDEGVMALAEQNTKEGKLARQLRELAEHNKRLESRLTEREKQEAEWRDRQRLEQQSASRQQAVSEFTKLATNADEFPALSRVYKGREKALIRDADDVWDEYHQSDYYKRTGDRISLKDVAEYLDKQLKSNIGLESSQKAESSQGSVPQSVRAKTVGRTVTTANASERRTVDMSPEDMTDDERREAAKAAAKKAIREHAA